MFSLIHKIVTSSLFKFILRFLASLASAIAVISGYLFFVSINIKDKEDEVITEKKSENKEEKFTEEKEAE